MITIDNNANGLKTKYESSQTGDDRFDVLVGALPRENPPVSSAVDLESAAAGAAGDAAGAALADGSVLRWDNQKLIFDRRYSC